MDRIGLDRPAQALEYYNMPDIRLIASRHSAFYSPLISMIAGGFLENEGLSATYTPAAPGQNSAIEVAESRADIGQSAVSGSWGALDAGQKPPVAHFAQINAFDGFIVAAREPDLDFQWEKLLDAKFLVRPRRTTRSDAALRIAPGRASTFQTSKVSSHLAATR